MSSQERHGGPITSTKNPKVVAAARLHRARHRRETGRTIIEGPQVVRDALAAGVEIIELFGLDDDVSRGIAADAEVLLTAVTEPVLGRVSDTERPRGPVAVIAIPQSEVPDGARLLVTWGVGDPGNCGTLVRTAAAFGYGYVSGPASADPWSPKVLRSAAGGHFRTSVGSVTAIEDLAAHRLIATVARDGQVPTTVSAGEAVLIGSEANGLPPDVVDVCERAVTIPMADSTESLNAAVAGAIVAYLGGVPGSD